MYKNRGEKGEALLESLLFAPVLLLLGIMATEFGLLSLRRAQLSEAIRASVAIELLDLTKNSSNFNESNSLTNRLQERIAALSGIDSEKAPIVKLNVVERSANPDPSYSLVLGEEFEAQKLRKVEVQVVVHVKGLLSGAVSLPPLNENVTYSFRN